MNDKIIVIFLATIASIMALLPHRAAAVFGASMKWPLQTDGIFIWT
jgi:hypothetical protein